MEARRHTSRTHSCVWMAWTPHITDRIVRSGKIIPMNQNARTPCLMVWTSLISQLPRKHTTDDGVQKVKHYRERTGIGDTTHLPIRRNQQRTSGQGLLLGIKDSLKCYRVGHDKHETHQVQCPTPVHAALKTGGKLLVSVLQRVSVCPHPPPPLPGTLPRDRWLAAPKELQDGCRWVAGWLAHCGDQAGSLRHPPAPREGKAKG